MSGVSASTLVIFIASIVVAAGVAGTLVTTVGEISTSAETQGDQITESIDANIELLNDGGGSNFYVEDNFDDGHAAEITVYVRNTGSTTLTKNESELDVLVNGLFVDTGNLNVTSMNGNDDRRAWVEDEVIEIVIKLDDPLDGSGNRLTVSPEGTERSLEFDADTNT
jgi:flagellar protein FlaG